MLSRKKYKIILILLFLFLGQDCSRDILDLDTITLEDRVTYQWTQSFSSPLQPEKWQTFTNSSYENRNGRNRLVYKIHIPPKRFIEPALYLPNIFQIFDVALENKIIYTTGNVNRKGNAFYGYEWHIIPLPEQVAGKDIMIRVYSANPFVIGFSSPAWYGNRYSLMTQILEKDYGIFFTGIANVMVFFISFLGFLVLKERIFLLFSLQCIAVGIYFINLSDISQFLYSNAPARILIWELSSLGILVTLKFYFENLLKKSKVLDYWLYVLLFVSIIKYPLVGLDSFNEYSIALNITIMLGVTIMVLQTLQLAIAGNKEAIALTITLGVIVTLIFYDVFGEHLQHRNNSILHYAFMLFIFTNGYISIQKHYTLIQSTSKIQFENEKNLKELAESKFQKLSEKMSPHFLFNTLNLVHSYVFFRPKVAKRALQYLSENFRYIIDQTDGKSILLKNEWEFTRSYLNLLKMRFSKRVNFTMKATDKVFHLPIPPLSIQPFVENAYKHGIRNSSVKGMIQVEAKKYLDGAIIAIRDNGIGMNDYSFSHTLTNIKDRFLHLYKNAEIIMVNNADADGVTVAILFYNRKKG